MAAQMAAVAMNGGGSPGAVTAAAAAAVGGVGAAQPSLYVGDLEASVTDSQLYELFSQAGTVMSVRVCRDVNTRRSLGYAYVNFNNPVDAARALELLNFAPLNSKPIRVMYSNRDPSSRRSGSANIFIKNLDKAIDNKTLHDTFSAFGKILSCKVATDGMGQSKGFGFVQYEKGEDAQSAIKSLNGMLINDKPVYVGPFLRKQERENSVDKTKFNNVFVKNLSESTAKEDLVKVFGAYGNITSAVVMVGMDGKSRCFGFINFESPDDAARAVEELNGKKINDKEWYVGRAQKKSEREMELKRRFEQSMRDAADKYQGLNLYLKNLDDSIGDDQLCELFSNYGKITSYKIMRDANGVSKGSGFVAFSTREEASQALTEMNGKMISGKPLYVALAQRKEDRKAMLQAQFSQNRPVPMTPSMAPRLPMYPPMAPLGQQLFYGQAPSAILPPQPGFGFQQQLVPGMRPSGTHMPNYYVPVVQQGQQGPRPGIRRSGAGSAQGHQSAQSFQQQMLPRGRVYRYPPARSMPDVPPMPGVAGGMIQSYDMGGYPVRDAGLSPSPIGMMTSALANANPEQQRTILGENLYPLVELLEHNHAAKVTGMLLEMDKTEVLHLLESPEALRRYSYLPGILAIEARRRDYPVSRSGIDRPTRPQLARACHSVSVAIARGPRSQPERVSRHAPKPDDLYLHVIAANYFQNSEGTTRKTPPMQTPRARLLHSCGESILSMARNAYRRVEAMRCPVGCVARGVSRAAAPVLGPLRRRCLAALAFADRQLLVVQDVAGVLFPHAERVLGKADDVVLLVESLPARLDGAFDGLEALVAGVVKSRGAAGLFVFPKQHRRYRADDDIWCDDEDGASLHRAIEQKARKNVARKLESLEVVTADGKKVLVDVKDEGKGEATPAKGGDASGGEETTDDKAEVTEAMREDTENAKGEAHEGGGSDEEAVAAMAGTESREDALLGLFDTAWQQKLA
uniref:PABP n=1 Tax=Leersia perrieri TaxID=77586 RepID=A0A0D9W6V6_9ORYZ